MLQFLYDRLLNVELDSVQGHKMIIFDDAHSLHPAQLAALQRWLARRELKVSRWILTRLDALTPADVLLDAEPQDGEEPGLKRAREFTDIWMQSTDDRLGQRLAFRKMARDMAGRYLSQMEVFNTSVGVTAARRSIERAAGAFHISLSTAHPAKFSGAVDLALRGEEGFDFEAKVLPKEFVGLEQKERRVSEVDNDWKSVREVVKKQVEQELGEA